MEQTTKMTPRDFFMNLLGFVALYACVISFLTLLFQYVNVLFPDKLDFYYSGILDAIRISTSILLVMFAVFIITNWLLEKDFAKNTGKRDLKFRKWLTYFTLFAAAISIIVDLIILVNNFYNGELSLRFVLKVIVVLLVAAAVFGYYFWDLKRESSKKYQLPKLAAWLAGVIVIISIVGGFFIVGSPTVQRQRRFDDQRVNSLQMIQNEVVNYWQQKEKLPENLSDLTNSISGFVAPVDPETNASYVYKAVAPLTFELCAVFSQASENDVLARDTRPQEVYVMDPYKQNFSHGVGEVCFSRTIDPDLYKLNKN